MTDIVDLNRSNSLVDLAARINAEHEAVAGAMKRGLEHAINAGKLLIEAKAQLKHGQWLPWLCEHCQIPERTARLYMQLANHAPEIGSVADLTMRGAIKLLGPPSEAARRQRTEAAAVDADDGDVADDEGKAVPPEEIRDNLLNTIEEHRALVLAYKRVLKASLQDHQRNQAVNDEMSTAIGGLITRWQSLQRAMGSVA